MGQRIDTRACRSYKCLDVKGLCRRCERASVVGLQRRFGIREVCKPRYKCIYGPGNGIVDLTNMVCQRSSGEHEPAMVREIQLINVSSCTFCGVRS